MKKVIIFFLKKTGIYNEIYKEGINAAGDSLKNAVPYYYGHTNSDIKIIGDVLEEYGNAFQVGVYPDDYNIRHKILNN